MVNFQEACEDVLKNDVEYVRDGIVGMRLRTNSIEFFVFKNNKTMFTQEILIADLESDWTLIKPKIVPLSEKIDAEKRVVYLKDVKEAIKNIKKEIAQWDDIYIRDIMDKHIGEL